MLYLCISRKQISRQIKRAGYQNHVIRASDLAQISKPLATTTLHGYLSAYFCTEAAKCFRRHTPLRGNRNNNKRAIKAEKLTNNRTGILVRCQTKHHENPIESVP